MNGWRFCAFAIKCKFTVTIRTIRRKGEIHRLMTVWRFEPFWGRFQIFACRVLSIKAFDSNATNAKVHTVPNYYFKQKNEYFSQRMEARLKIEKKPANSIHCQRRNPFYPIHHRVSYAALIYTIHSGRPGFRKRHSNLFWEQWFRCAEETKE